MNLVPYRAKRWDEFYREESGMKLSEAIIQGSRLWPETHHERFVRRADGQLCADAWGAACGALAPRLADLNWNWRAEPQKAEASQGRLVEVQMEYFRRYFEMPARCPGASQQFERARGRVVNRKGDVAVEAGAKTQDAGGMTSECDRVTHLAGAVDHLFYAHNWSREQVAQVVEWYEEMRTDAALAIAFTHFRTPTLQSQINQRLLARAKQNIEARAARRQYFHN